MLNLSLLSFPGLIFVLYPQNVGTQKDGVHLYGHAWLCISRSVYPARLQYIYSYRKQICADLGLCNAREQYDHPENRCL